MDTEALEDLIEPYEYCQLYTLFDADKSGAFLRKVMDRVYPEARQLQTLNMYKEVATTPRSILGKILLAENFKIKQKQEKLLETAGNILRSLSRL